MAKTNTEILAKRLNARAKVFIGVDQTGAVLPNGKPKPLPLAIATIDPKPSLRLTDRSGRALALASFNKESVEDSVAAAFGDGQRSSASSSSTVLLVDCVFGLPREAWPQGAPPGSSTLWRLFRKAASQPVSGKSAFGLQPAARYFAELLEESEHPRSAPHPVRECEILAKANSVFRTHPFQKNIQCGTYRIWRELGETASPWVQIRHFEKSYRIRDDRPWMFEAYPSLVWRRFLGLKSRDLSKLREAAFSVLPDLEIERRDLDLLQCDPDHADAGVLALGGILLRRSGELFKAVKNDSELRFAHEGWIAGLEFSRRAEAER